MNKDFRGYFICVLIGIVFGAMVAYILTPIKVKEVYKTTPVEKNIHDTLYIRHDSIIYRTKYIREIQHDTIEKVYTLDDSSSVDLFYKLVSE
jgi:hypothetical protein